MKKFIYLLIFVLAFELAGCSSSQKKNQTSGIIAVLPSYQTAVMFYQSANYELALRTIEGFIQTKPHSLRYKESLYLKGKILKQLGRAQECVDTLGAVIELSKGTKDSFFAYALYYTGLCYELQSETERAIAVYQDALKARDLPIELKNLELPARLAIAYSRIGDDVISKRYYDKTKVELGKLKKTRLKVLEQREMLSEILINMGTLTQSFGKDQDFENYLESIRLTQEYLVLVFQMDTGVQSERALALLVDHFEGASVFIQKLEVEPAEDEVVAERSRQEKQKKLANVLLENIENFETYLTPESQSKDIKIENQMSRIINVRSNLEKILDEKLVGQGLTPEAVKLLNPKIDGKMRDKKTSLEEKASLPEKKKKD